MQNSKTVASQVLASVPSHLAEQIQKLPLDWCREILIAKALKAEQISGSLLNPIDYAYRPRSYWSNDNLLQLIANIKGAARKKAAHCLLKQGRLEEAYDFILRDSLDDRLRG